MNPITVLQAELVTDGVDLFWEEPAPSNIDFDRYVITWFVDNKSRGWGVSTLNDGKRWVHLPMYLFVDTNGYGVYEFNVRPYNTAGNPYYPTSWGAYVSIDVHPNDATSSTTTTTTLVSTTLWESTTSSTTSTTTSTTTVPSTTVPATNPTTTTVQETTTSTTTTLAETTTTSTTSTTTTSTLPPTTTSTTTTSTLPPTTTSTTTTSTLAPTTTTVLATTTTIKPAPIVAPDQKGKQQISVQAFKTATDALQTATTTEIVAIVAQLASYDLSSQQATALATEPAVLGVVTQEQAHDIFDDVQLDELDKTTVEELVAAIQDTTPEVRAAFEDEINVFSGYVDQYVPLGSSVPVSVRRTLVATSATMVVAAPIAPTRKRQDVRVPKR